MSAQEIEDLIDEIEETKEFYDAVQRAERACKDSMRSQEMAWEAGNVFQDIQKMESDLLKLLISYYRMQQTKELAK